MDTIGGLISRILGKAKAHEAGPGPRRRFFKKKKTPRPRYIVNVDSSAVRRPREARCAGRIASATWRGRRPKRWTVKAWATRLPRVKAA